MKRFLIACLLSVFTLALHGKSGEAAPGDLDTSFGQNGFAFADFDNIGLDFSSARGVAIQSDGKIVVAGHARTTGVNFSQTALVVARFNANGSADPTFGNGGKVVTTFDTFAEGVKVAIQPADGKIVVAGFTAPDTSSSSPASLALARYTSTGSLDPSFGSGGKVTTPIGVGGSISSMILHKGRILVAGTIARPNTGLDFLLVRFLNNGALDTSFGSTGLPNPTGFVTTDFGGQENAHAITLQSQGKIIVAGVNQVSVDSQFVIARYRSNGLLDGTFGNSGKVFTNFVTHDHGGSSGDSPFDIAVQADGKIVVAGCAETNTGLATTDVALARFNTNGTLDTAFGNGGKVTTPFSTNTSVSDKAFAMVIQPDGRIVIAGFTGPPGSTVFAVARYNTTGGLNATFGNGGKVTTDRRGHLASAMAIQRVLFPFVNGKLIVAGEGAPSGATTRMAVARFIAF
jgi:uncharacterized delta-60 repeat protein